MTKNDLPKLVRDKIPEIIKRSGRTCKFRKANLSEVDQLLSSKLNEESSEFFHRPSLMEAADIYEVFLCILESSSLKLSDVIHCADLKRTEKGSFKDHLVLEGVGM